MERLAIRRAVVAPRAAGVVVVVALLLFGWCRPALALQPTVVDGADMLAPETVDKANATIRQIKRAFAKDVMVETYATVPKELEPELQKQGKEQFYAEWVLSRARALQANGVFILIVKGSGRLQIEVGRETRQKAFTLADRTELRQLMVKSFQDKQFDKGLLDGLEFIVRRMERNTGIPAGTPPTVGHPPAGAAGAGVAGAGTGGTGIAPPPISTTAPASAPATTPTAPTTAPIAPATLPATAPTTAPTTTPAQSEGDF